MKLVDTSPRPDWMTTYFFFQRAQRLVFCCGGHPTYLQSSNKDILEKNASY